MDVSHVVNWRGRLRMECLHISIDILGGWHLIWDEHLFEVEWVVRTVTEVHGLD
jgi:hypothetical protein